LLAASAGAYVLTRDRGELGSFTNWSFLKAFVLCYVALSFLWLIYARYLVPKWLSPLLKLPQPTVSR